MRFPGQPVSLSIDHLLEQICAWQDAGIAETGLRSETGGRFLLTLRLAGLADRLSRVRLRDEPAVPHSQLEDIVSRPLLRRSRGNVRRLQRRPGHPLSARKRCEPWPLPSLLSAGLSGG